MSTLKKNQIVDVLLNLGWEVQNAYHEAHKFSVDEFSMGYPYGLVDIENKITKYQRYIPMKDFYNFHRIARKLSYRNKWRPLSDTTLTKLFKGVVA